MAEFITKCPHCNNDLQVQDEWIGMEVECPLCKANFMIVKSSTGKKQCDFAKNNSFTKRKLYVVSIAIIVFIAIVITSIILCNDIGTTSPAIKTEENTVQKNKRLGLHFSFKWGYLLDDLDQSEFTSLTKTLDYSYVDQYKIVTKNNYQYNITVRKSSREISQIFSEDHATIQAFIAEYPHILESQYKVKENEIASCYYLDCVDDDVLLVVSKNNENKKVLILEQSIGSTTRDQYFNVALNSF